MSPSLYKKRKKDALKKLLCLADGKKVNIARELGLTEQTVQMWFIRGQISQSGAVKIAEHEYFGKHLTKEEMRPDVNW